MKSFEGEKLSAAGCEAFAGAPPLIPDHELLRPVGRGSDGEVWLARNALGAYRAVKVVHQKSFESERPYEREFSGIKRFEPISRSHEGFVYILQVGRNQAQGYFYYVMELADDANAGVAADTSAPMTDNPELRLSAAGTNCDTWDNLEIKRRTLQKIPGRSKSKIVQTPKPIRSPCLIACHIRSRPKGRMLP